MSTYTTDASAPLYFTHLSLVGILYRTFDVLIRRDYNRVLMKILAFIILLWFVMLTAMVSLWAPQNEDDAELAGTILNLLLTTYGSGAMIHAVATIYLGMTPDWKACLMEAVLHQTSLLIPTFLLVGILMLLIIVPAYLFWITFFSDSERAVTRGILAVPVIAVCCFYILTCFALIFPSIMIENKSAVGGIRRAFELARGHWCSTFCPF